MSSPKVVKAKKKQEFSKKWLIACMSVTIFFCTLSYVLSFLEKDPVQELSAAIINAMFIVDGTSFLAYALQNSMRAYAQDKYLTKRKEK